MLVYLLHNTFKIKIYIYFFYLIKIVSIWIFTLFLTFENFFIFLLNKCQDFWQVKIIDLVFVGPLLSCKVVLVFEKVLVSWSKVGRGFVAKLIDFYLELFRNMWSNVIVKQDWTFSIDFSSSSACWLFLTIK